jgi:3-oxoacyl-[acyl-carrier protein] reductase
VTDHGAIENALDRVESALGPIDILINNAGVAVSKAVLEQTEADWDKVLDTDLKGAFFTAPGGRETHGGARAEARVGRHHRQHRLGPRPRRGRSPRPLRRIQGRPLAADPDHGAGARRRRRPVNALAPGYIETEINRDFLATEAASGCESASRSVASARRTISTARSFSSPRMLPAT